MPSLPPHTIISDPVHTAVWLARPLGAPTVLMGVHLDVAADNANAIAFYEHLGFATLHRLETSILMGLRLA